MLTGKKILIVDDSAAVRGQICDVLVSAGFEVIEAADGLEGFQTIVARADLAAVICDLNMPRMNGLQMLEFVKAKGHLAGLPVVLLTTEGQPRLLEQAKKAGARGLGGEAFQARVAARCRAQGYRRTCVLTAACP